jgi:hypothetical protein
VKVGKNWFIKRPPLHAFAMRHGFENEFEGFEEKEAEKKAKKKS